MTYRSYPHNTSDTQITFDSRERHFIVYLNNYSCFRDDPKEIRRLFGKARNVPSVKAIEAWCIEQLESVRKKETSYDKDRILQEGFGPEAHGEEEPNDNTRMII